MINCNEDETQQHLSMDCYRAKVVWDKLGVYGLNVDLSYKSVMYCIVDEPLPEKQKELLKIIICIVCMKLWKTRCCMVIQQTVINSADVCKQVLAEIRRRRTLDRKQLLPWDTLNLWTTALYKRLYMHFIKDSMHFIKKDSMHFIKISMHFKRGSRHYVLKLGLHIFFY